MAYMAFTLPVLPGKAERFKNWYQEALTKWSKNDIVESRKRLGLKQEMAFYQQTPMGDFANIVFESDAPDQVLHKMATATQPFDVWFRDYVKDVHGVDLTQPPPGPPPTQIFDYKA